MTGEGNRAVGALQEDTGAALHRWGGTLVVSALGAWVSLESLNYPLGTIRNVGPGSFPLTLGLLLVGLGLALFWDGIAHESRARFVWRPLLAICAAMAAFAALMELSGAIAAACALVVIAELAEKRYGFLKVGLLCLGLTGFLIVITSLLSDTLFLRLY